MLELPKHTRPGPNLVNVFINVPDFRDGLRELGGLNKFQYTRLRMTCKTIAEGWKAFPEDPVSKDTKNPYFQGLKPVLCDELDCGNSSDLVAVRRCFGRFHPGTFSGCNKSVCSRCVLKAQQSFDRGQSKDIEIHWCLPCGRRQKASGNIKPCHCGVKFKDNICRQQYFDWQCMPCRATGSRVLDLKAHMNLTRLEEMGNLIARAVYFAKDCSHFKRWIDDEDQNRNHCPGCGKNYFKLRTTYRIRCRQGFHERRMFRQCMACLGSRP